MAKHTGTPTIWKHAKKIAQVFGDLGGTDLASALSENFRVAVVALSIAVQEIKAADDYPLQIDRTLPAGPEDTIGP